ncbi:glycosyltransferase family 4 protein [Acinetobacter sp. ANC 4178]|uniref:glycosyltransferase family 4 protein n=1 Tax=Acinetobacter sp. ANC 4178 TaxID=2529839 RepID=UPI00103F15AE|nr:glycosyltransferase family 1 protein [Acinetobacter sp. ANC 4178]TCB67567.1 glycosyltransferase family 1 protein [Acinetobacter sp. ANC 4178]
MSYISTASLLKQQDFPESFKFYFRLQQNKNSKEEVNVLKDLVRPRLKIAIVTETWPPEVNGVALSLMHLCKGLQRQGHKILLIRPNQTTQSIEFSPNKECLVTAQSIPKYPSLQFGWPQFLKVANALDEFMPNVVHIVTEGPLGLTALHAAKSRNIPVSSGFHSPFQDFSRFFDLAFLVKPIQHYLRWFHNNTQLTCVPSKDTQNALKQFGITCPLVVVGRGVDTQQFSPNHRSDAYRCSWGADSNTTVMLYVGRLSPEKEIDVLIRNYICMLQRCEKHYKLVITGDGPDRQRLEALGKAHGVIFTGSLTGKNLASVYASADVFVFASQVETFGNVVLEAMASGLPVVAYNYACAHAHIEQGKTGWLSPLNDVHAFSNQMQNLPRRQQLNTMGQSARLNVMEMGWHHPVTQLEQALYQVAKETRMIA